MKKLISIPLLFLSGIAHAASFDGAIDITAKVKAFDANCTLTVPPVDFGQLEESNIGSIQTYVGISKVSIEVSCDQDVSYKLFTDVRPATGLTVNNPMFDQPYLYISNLITVGGAGYRFSIYSESPTETFEVERPTNSFGFLNKGRQAIIGNVAANTTNTHDITVVVYSEKYIETTDAVNGTWSAPITYEVII